MMDRHGSQAPTVTLARTRSSSRGPAVAAQVELRRPHWHALGVRFAAIDRRYPVTALRRQVGAGVPESEDCFQSED